MSVNTAKIKEIVLNFLVPIICVGSSILLFILIVYPSLRSVPALQQDLSDAIALRDQLKEKQVKLSRFVDFKDVVTQNSALVNEVLPIEQNVPGLLDQLNQIANESGLNVNKLSYSLADFSISGNSTDSSANTVLVSLGAEGTYEQMIAFMKAVENASRLVNISNFRFSAGSQDKVSTLSFTFILSAPFMNVQSKAVTDDPIKLDITSGEFVSFLNKIKALRYFEKSGDLSALSVKAVQEDITAQESSQSSPSKH